METVATLLCERAQATPDATAYTFLDHHGEISEELRFDKLFERAKIISAALAHYPPQTRIVIALPTSAQFCAVFYGCMLSGKIAVPTPLPNVHRFGAVLQIVAECQADCIVTIPALLPGLRLALQQAGLTTVAVRDYADLQQASDAQVMMPTAHDIALLQFTSGSTAMPKGVIISHANIMANEKMIYAAFGHSAQSTVVGWVPLHHDQGLIGNLLQPLYAGSHCILLDPLSFLRAPQCWLQAISRYRAQTSGGPNFGYDLCVTRIREEHCTALDLSSWTLAFNGAEPINPATLRRFADKFGPYGFRMKHFFVCYGLAEASLYVSGAHVENADATAIHAGYPHPEMSVLLRPRQEQEQEQREKQEADQDTPQEGEEICIAGPNVTRGYWGGRDDDAFFEHDGKRYLRTGDLGYIKNGCLTIAGRAKELMIIRGRNVYPYDLERTILASHPMLLDNACAVLTLDTDGEQEVVAVQEVTRTARHTLDYNEIAALVRKNVVRQHDVFLKLILFTQPGFIPRTSSGKIKRNQLAANLREIGGTNEKIITTA